MDVCVNGDSFVPQGNHEDAWNTTISDACDSFVAACNDVISFLVDSKIDRKAAKDTALEEFKGYFADLFKQNYEIQHEDRFNLLMALASVRNNFKEAMEAAQDEQDRRKKAREFEKEHKEWEANSDSWWYRRFHSEPEAEVSLNIPDPPQIQSSEVKVGEHEIPTPGTQSESCSESSAIPDNLNKFVTDYPPIDEDLTALVTKLEAAWTDMETAWTWKSDFGIGDYHLIQGMDSLIGSFAQYINANYNDVAWVNLISVAFTIAGQGDTSLASSLPDYALYLFLQEYGVDAYRENVEIPELYFAGLVPTTGYADDPVCVVNGNFVEPETDLIFNTSAVSSTLNLTRTYNSAYAYQQAKSDFVQQAVSGSKRLPGDVSEVVSGVGVVDWVGCFGVGWTSVLDQQLLFTKDGICWISETGRQIYFSNSNDINVGASDNVFSGVQCVGGGFWLKRINLADFDFLHEALPEDLAKVGTVFPPSIANTNSTADTTDTTVISIDATSAPTISGAGVSRTVTVSGLSTNVDTGATGSTADSSVTATAVDNSADLGWLVADSNGSLWLFLECGLPVGFTQGAGSGVKVLRNWTNPASGTQVTGLVHEFSRWLRVSYNEAGLVSQVTDDSDRTVSYVYENGCLIGVDRGFSLRTYGLNQEGLIDQVVSETGVVECVNEYDDQGRVTSQVSSFGRRSRFVYLPGGLCVVSDMDGKRSNTWISDVYGRLVGVLDAVDERVSLGYDQWGNLIRVVDREGRSLARRFDERSHLLREVLFEGGVFDYEWDEQNRLTSVSSNLHKTKSRQRSVNIVGEFHTGITRFEYATDNSLDRHPVRVIDPAGGVTQFTWNKGLLTGCVDPTGVKICLEYNSHGELIRTKAGENRGWLELARSKSGQVSELVTPLGFVTRLVYGAKDLCEKILDPDGSSWEYDYDEFGRLVGVVAPDGGKTQVSYDPVTGLASSWTNPLGWQIQQKVDDLGNLSELVLPGRITWSFTHDAMSRLSQLVDPRGGVWSYEYDKNGRPQTVTNPLNQSFSQVFDPALGQLVVRDSQRQVKSITYFDPFDRPTQHYVSTGLGVKSSQSGDNPLGVGVGPFKGGVSSSSSPSTGTSTSTSGFMGVGVVYDARGLIAEQVDSDDGRVCYTYDLTGRPTRVENSNGEWIEAVYDDCGRLTKTTTSNGMATVYEYDADHRLITKTQTQTKGQISIRTMVEVFEYDACNRVTRIAQNGKPTHTFAYDVCGRVLSCWDRELGERHFKYDLAGQLVESTNPLGGVTRYEYTAPGWLTGKVLPDGTRFEYEHNQLGQVTKTIYPDGSAASSDYDALGRISSVVRPDGSQLSYSREPNQTRVSLDNQLLLETVYSPEDSTYTVKHHVSADDTVSTDVVANVDAKSDDSTAATSSVVGCGNDTASSTDSGENVPSPSSDATASSSGKRIRVWKYQHALNTPNTNTSVADANTNVVNTSTNANSSDITSVDSSASTNVNNSDTTGRSVVFDDWGRPSRICRNGVWVEYAYTSGNQLSKFTTSGGVSGNYEYDLLGRVTRTITKNASKNLATRVEYVYNQMGQLTQTTTTTHPLNQTQTIQLAKSLQTTQFVYDALGRRTRMHCSNGSACEYKWNDLGFLQQVVYKQNEHTTRVVEVETDVWGNPTRIDDDVFEWDTTYVPARLVKVNHQPITTLDFSYLRTQNLTDNNPATSATAGGDFGVDDWFVGRVCLENPYLPTHLSLDTLLHHAKQNTQDSTRNTASTDSASVSGDFGGVCLGFSGLGIIPGASSYTDSNIDPSFSADTILNTGLNGSANNGRDSVLESDTSLVSSTGTGAGTDTHTSTITDANLADVTAAGVGLFVGVGGLFFMGARVYDPAILGFLSRDPLQEGMPVGCVGEHNVYGFAFHNPIMFSDPLGLAPITDPELINLYNQNRSKSIGEFVSDNWEYFVAGAMVTAGAVMVATGVGAAVGSGLIGSGISAAVQKYTTGEVNWVMAAADGAMSIGTGGVGLLTSTRTVASGLARTTGSTITKTGTSGISRAASSLKTTLKSKDTWIRFGVNTTKNTTLDGLSYVLGSKIEGKEITLSGWLTSMTLNKVTGVASSGTNYAIRKGLEKYVSKEVSHNLADLASGFVGSTFNYTVSSLMEGKSLEKFAEDFAFYVGFGTATSWGSSWSTRKMIESGTSSGGELSSGDLLALELSAGSLADMNAFALNISAKGIYEEFSLSESQSPTDAQDTDTPSETDIQDSEPVTDDATQ